MHCLVNSRSLCSLLWTTSKFDYIRENKDLIVEYKNSFQSCLKTNINILQSNQ